MEDEDIKKELEQLIAKLDLSKALKKVFYQGFDNYEDYVKYGDLFAPLKLKEKNES